MSRTLPLLLALLLLAAAAPVADAARRSGVDLPARVRLTLDGRELTANDYAPPGAGWFSFESDDEMWQRPERLRAACGTTFRPFRRSQRDRYVLVNGSWPRERRRATFTFRRDISARVSWCLIEGLDGGDVAFVSFLRGEPRRRVAGGRDRDGSPWTLAAWRSDRLAPCVRLRAHGRWQERCFDDYADADAQLAAEVEDSRCRESAFVYGVAPRAAVRIDVTRSGGTLETFPTLAPPPGSRMRARPFAVEMWDGATVIAIEAFDADGRSLGALDELIRLCR